MRSWWKGIIVFIALFILCNSCASQQHNESYPLLKLKWTAPIQSDDVYMFDFDKDGIPEVYASSFDIVRSYLYALNLEGNLEYKTWVDKIAQRKMVGCGAPQRHTKEKIMYFMPGDFDGDSYLDIIAGSSMKGTSFVEERVYYFEKEGSVVTEHDTKFRWDHIMGDIPSDVKFIKRKAVIASLDSSVYVLNEWGELTDEYVFDGAVWDMKLVRSNTLEGAIFATFKGLYTIESGAVKQILETSQRVYKVDSGDTNTDGLDEIVALLEDDSFIMLDRNMNIIQKEELEGLVDSHILEFKTDKFSRVLIATNKIIYSMDELGNLMVEKILGDHINAIYVYSIGDESRYVAVATNANVYLYEINPEFVVYHDGKYFFENARAYYLTEGNCVKALEYAKACRDLFQDIGYVEGTLRCHLIIAECEGYTPPENKSLKAEKYYIEAINLSENGRYELAISYAQISFDLFFDAEDKNGILKSDKLILDIKRSWKAHSDNLYSSSLDYLAERDYDNAILYAEESKHIYSKLNNSQGVDNTVELISEAKILRDADASLLRAQTYLDEGYYVNATEHARIAMEAFYSVGYLNKSAQAEHIINVSTQHRQADSYLETARDYFNSEDYVNASTYLDLAKEMYGTLGDEAGVEQCVEIQDKITVIQVGEREKWALYMHVAAVMVMLFILTLIINFVRKKKLLNRYSKIIKGDDY
ncbi:MAG: hypothetical protein B6U97_02440 [Candidatus Altiarchaeales archaeon ex4484_96]|nr:MAG: hypothetical protein B6U97_02440 [Candidatus Altiarchaeales archaeon ex4484_96]